MNDTWMIAELTYALRLVVDKFENKDLSESEREVLMMAYRALTIPPRAIQELVNDMESAE